MKEPLPVPTLPYGYGGSPQASMGMYQQPGATAQQYPHVRNLERSLENIRIIYIANKSCEVQGLCADLHICREFWH